VNFIKEKTLKFILFFKKRLNSFNFYIAKLFSFKKKKQQEELDKNLVYSLSRTNIPNQDQLKHINRLLSKKEKFIIYLASFLILLNLIFLGNHFYQKYFISVAKDGGVYVEGVLGLPRFINPLYAIDRDVDSDLSYLIFSRLFTYDKQGEIKGDLVKDWEISEDNLEYTIYLKENVKWHNGEDLKADDVWFTFYLMKNPDFRSPWQRNLAGIDLEKIDDYTLKFIIQEPYAPLFELLTFGILPRFAWEATNSDFILLSDLNLKPIGSGAYKFKSLVRNTGGEIKEYRLEVNEDYYEKKPYIKEILFKFYFDYPQLLQALNDQEVDAIAYLPPELISQIVAKNSFNIHSLALPQINALFFKQNVSKLKDKNVRKALAISLNRDKLIERAVNNFACRSDGPLPISSLAYNHNLKPLTYSLSQAEKLLNESAWTIINFSDLNNEEDEVLREKIQKYSEDNNIDISKKWLVNKETEEIFTIKLSFISSNENKILAKNIKEYWNRLGIRTLENSLSSEEFQNDLINERDFEVLLQKQMIGSDPDVSAFWHSSQKNTGLNLINYQNPEVDEILNKARQLSSDIEQRVEKYENFQELLVEELPAIFLYSSNYPYIQNKKLKGFSGQVLIEPSYRFNSINDWYLRTRKIFKP
jgi:peptide/nickel transport system substrate-binding protein